VTEAALERFQRDARTVRVDLVNAYGTGFEHVFNNTQHVMTSLA
jgi:hypothetical protein